MPEKKEQKPVIEHEKELRISVENALFKKLEEIKKFFGIKNTTEIIRYLITSTHWEVQDYHFDLNIP